MKLNSYLLKSSLVAALGGLLFGFDTVVIAGANDALKKIYDLTPALLGFTVASAILGTTLGSILAGMPADRYGRRRSLFALAILYFITALGCAMAWNWGSFLFFRFLGGLAIGGSSVIGPMYIAEISPARARGRLVGFFQFNIVFGILLAYLSNYLLGLGSFGGDEWRWKLGVAAIPAAAFFVMLFPIPESPRWLVKRSRVDEASEVLRLTGEENYKEELADIVASIDAEHGKANEPLFTWKYRFPIFLAITIGMFNQLSGINAVLYYLNNIFESAGFSKTSGDLQAVAIGFTNLVATMIAMTVIDKIGRKTMLLIGSIGTAISLAGVAWIFSTKANEHLLVWLLISFIAFFAFSQGAVIWVYLSEVFPTRVRARGQSLGSFTHWAMNAMIAGTFPVIAASSGAAPFAVFAAMMLVQFAVVAVWYPETKGHTLEEMQKKLGIS
ncbi:MAG: sugar porter family MFS transporter [Acidobacteria bacterium]|nr:sugar porter family MFS transporter [Acidobacteriota bacterium]